MRPIPASRTLRYVALAVVVVVAAGAAAAVFRRSSKDDRPQPETPTAESPTPIEVTLDGGGYRSDRKKVVAGWIEVTFRNRTPQIGSLALVRLAPGTTAADLDRALDDPKALEALGGSYVFQGGATMVPAQATVSFRTEVFAGHFLFGGLPELARGAGEQAALEVGPGDPPLSDPATPVTIRLGAFSHAFNADMRRAGPQMVSVVGEGPGTHEVRLYKVLDGVAPTAAYPTVPAMKEAPDSPTRFVRPELGVSAMDPGFVNVRELSLTPGDYIMTCFLLDADTGRTYAELGMSTPFQVS